MLVVVSRILKGHLLKYTNSATCAANDYIARGEHFTKEGYPHVVR